MYKAAGPLDAVVSAAAVEVAPHPVDLDTVALAYVRSREGPETGQVYIPGARQ